MIFWLPFIIIPEKIKKDWGKRSLKPFYLIISVAYITINLFYFMNLPKYTYHNAAMLIGKELDKEYIKAELLKSDKYNEYFNATQKHGLISYNLYTIAFNTNNGNMVYYFDQYTGEYDRIDNDLLKEMPK